MYEIFVITGYGKTFAARGIGHTSEEVPTETDGRHFSEEAEAEGDRSNQKHRRRAGLRRRGALFHPYRN